MGGPAAALRALPLPQTLAPCSPALLLTHATARTPPHPTLAPQVSAKSGEGVEDAFLTVVKAAAKRVRQDAPVIPDNIVLDKPAAPEKKGCC